MLTASAIAGALFALLLLVLVLRCVQSGARARPPSAVPTDALHDLFQARRDAIARRLSAALKLRTISYDDAAPEQRRNKPVCASFHEHAGGGSRDSAAPAAAAASPAASARTSTGVRRRRGASPSPARRAPATAAAAPASAAPSAPPPAAELAALAESRAALLAFHALLSASYPRMHASLERVVAGELSLGFLWRGSAPQLPATALYAHLDVVPAPDAAEWAHGPFSGDIAGGYVWGRGAIDDKQAVIGICEAVEHLLAAGFAPRRTLAVLFGHDEEVGGAAGAAALAAWLASALPPAAPPSNRQLAFLLDEGLFVLSGVVPGLSARTALICTAEKGCMSVHLDVAVVGGHASVPPADTAIGILSRALARLEARPFPASLRGAARAMFEALAPHMAPPLRLLFANLWLLHPCAARALARAPTTAALVRTTTALTVVAGGAKANVLPPAARAVVNHRMLPGTSAADVLAHDAAAIGDARVRLSVAPGASEASAQADAAAPPFRIIARAVEGLFANTVTAPALMLGATDSPWFAHLAAQVYRHCPTELAAGETAMFHGRDEKIAVDNLARIAAFYARVVIDADADAGF